ncbi:MAG: hypothetical protein Q8P41_22555 [Pseudomonadota bacterium]|nr:hypothetical protein [Pseudomonadota bacterium]
MTRAIASVLLSKAEERRLHRLARGRALGATLLRLAEGDIEEHGAEPAVIAPVPRESVARKLSVAIPPALVVAVDARRGTASYGTYLRTLLGNRTGAVDGVPNPSGEVVVRAARPLPPGRLGEVTAAAFDGDEIVEFVPDLFAFSDGWDQRVWCGLSQGEKGWLLLGLEEASGPSNLRDRLECEQAFAVVRGLFHSDPALNSRVVLHPSFVFLRRIPGKRIGQTRWVECDEGDEDCLVLMVRVEAHAHRLR